VNRITRGCLSVTLCVFLLLFGAPTTAQDVADSEMDQITITWDLTGVRPIAGFAHGTGFASEVAGLGAQVNATAVIILSQEVARKNIPAEAGDYRVWYPPDNAEAGDRETLRLIASLVDRGVSSFVLVPDQDITFLQHLTIDPGEFRRYQMQNQWAAQRVTNIQERLPGNWRSNLLPYSGGGGALKHIPTGTLSKFNYIAPMSACGDNGREFARRLAHSGLKVPPISFIEGAVDLPSITTEGFDRILKEVPGSRVITNIDPHTPGDYHSITQQRSPRATYKISWFDGTVIREAVVHNTTPLEIERDRIEGRTTQQPPERVPELPDPFPPEPPRTRRFDPTHPPDPPDKNGGAAGVDAGSNLGGIDFSSMCLRFFSESSGDSMRSIGAAYHAVLLPDTGRVVMDADAANALCRNSLCTWLALDNSAFWVNLNPNEPDRIIDSDFGGTDAGRILLEADLQMKRDLGRLTHPGTALGREFWTRAGGQRGGGAFRVWIVPGQVDVAVHEDAIYIVDARMDVRLESEYLAARDGARGITPASNEEEHQFKEMILPRLVDEVNSAPQYAALRQVFNTRVVAEWYKTRHFPGPAFASVVGSGDIGRWRSTQEWDPREVFNGYVGSLNRGEYDVSYRSESTSGNTRTIRTSRYFFGGVDFTQIPVHESSLVELFKRSPEVEERLTQALLSFGGFLDRDGVWFGAVDLQ